MKEYNTTQLYPEKEFEKHIFHRDQFAHYLRWTHVLKRAKIKMNILDIGCGNGNLFELLYRNCYRPARYLGLDIKNSAVMDAKRRFNKLSFAEFQQVDLCKDYDLNKYDWDIIACFEVIEHIGKHNADKFLQNIKKHMNEKSVLLLSTPCYDAKTGAANNHIINGKVCEFEFMELFNILSKHFIVENVFGTFASQKDYKEHMNEWQANMFNNLRKYYDSNLVSNLMAPFFPQYSRNCLWTLKKAQIEPIESRSNEIKIKSNINIC